MEVIKSSCLAFVSDSAFWGINDCLSREWKDYGFITSKHLKLFIYSFKCIILRSGSYG